MSAILLIFLCLAFPARAYGQSVPAAAGGLAVTGESALESLDTPTKLLLFALLVLGGLFLIWVGRKALKGRSVQALTAGQPDEGEPSGAATEEPAGELPEVAGELPEVAGELPEVAGELPEVAGELPEVAGEEPAGEPPAAAEATPPASLPEIATGAAAPAEPAAPVLPVASGSAASALPDASVAAAAPVATAEPASPALTPEQERAERAARAERQRAELAARAEQERTARLQREKAERKARAQQEKEERQRIEAAARADRERAEQLAREDRERAERAERAERQRAELAEQAERARLLSLEPSRSLDEGLSRTKKEGFIGRLARLFSSKKTIDQELLDQVEELLIKADIGVKTTERLVTRLKEESKRRDLGDPQAVWAFLKEESARILTNDAPPIQLRPGRPLVVMVVGVNGVGKTTTIGKLAARYVVEGKKVLIAAGDTFRAAAVEQLEIWAKRADVALVKGRADADPASVIFNAVQQARKDGADVVFADTAGRLHTKVPLMEELKKIHKVCGKAIEGAPDEVLLVLDATNGQNAVLQARQFSEAIGLTGIVLTKLDGTAKGGIVLAISQELQVPIRYIGIGEQVGDLRPFDPAEFVEALFQRESGSL